MTKQKTLWACTSCGHIENKWVGCCSMCKEWNTFEEETPFPVEETRYAGRPMPVKPVRIEEVDITSAPRMHTGFEEMDRLLGGGLVQGSLCLLGGEPGIGKSTLLLQLAGRLAAQGLVILYVCGEESAEQTSLRARRIGVGNASIYLLPETIFSSIRKQIDIIKPDILIIDSVQIVYKSELPSSPGSVTQVREIAMEAMQISKGLGITTFLIGHVTKGGELAGPRVLEHIVDTVLEFEGDRTQGYRMIRSHKNRFGPTDDVALFQMEEKGLREITNPSEALLHERILGVSGSVIIPTVEGTRALLVEVQALASSSAFTNSSRRSTGIDPKRLGLLLAVLEKRMGYQMHATDVFVSVAGGLRIYEPATDLGIVLAIASSFLNKVIPPDCVVVGEVGLNGEVRSVPRIESRIKEAINMGFKRCILAKKNLKGVSTAIREKITLFPIERVEEAIEGIIE